MSRLAPLTIAVALTLFASVAAQACRMQRPPQQPSSKTFAVAMTLEAGGDDKAATKSYEQVMNHGKALLEQRVVSAIHAGRLHQKAGHKDLSLRRFERAVALDAKSYEARLALGRSLLHRGELKDAERQLTTAVALGDRMNGEAGDALAALSIVLSKQERHSEAVDQLGAARLMGASATSLAEAESAVLSRATPTALAIQI